MLSLAMLIFAGFALAVVIPGLTDAASDDDDPIEGGPGDDTLSGTDGDDLLLGHAGNDGIKAEAGNDTLDGGAGSDSLEGGDGEDHLVGGNGGDQVFGGAGDDVLDDRFLNPEGEDYDPPGLLDGGAGDDTLIGSSGDRMIGNEGRDTFVIDADGGFFSYPTIADFNPNEDRLEVHYTPDPEHPPELSLIPDDDVAGANSYLEMNGVIIAYVLGEFGMDPTAAVLVPKG